MFAVFPSLRNLDFFCVFFTSLGDLVRTVWSFPHVTNFTMGMGLWRADGTAVDAIEYPGHCRDLERVGLYSVPGWEAVLPLMGFNLLFLTGVLSPAAGTAHGCNYKALSRYERFERFDVELFNAEIVHLPRILSHILCTTLETIRVTHWCPDQCQKTALEQWRTLTTLDTPRSRRYTPGPWRTRLPRR
ncbi:hypothetical protein LXA43DRAFT_607660 [Ganoderma leucocontextum]|nr:hypothetical protein LXA43DRAFT_607660 [Ganoderma leucocontextum]